MPLLFDRIAISTRQVLPNGFLKVDGVLARTGIQLYTAGELGVTDRPADAVVRVWRPPTEVFAPPSMASFQLVPLTDDHPEDMVTADNARDLGRGYTGESVLRDGDLLKAPIIVTDAATIRKLDDGTKSELSMGYTCDLEWTAGTSPQGETYDAIQRNIVGNHAALVDAGRCGAACRVLDKAPAVVKDAASCACQGGSPMADQALTKMMVDGVGLVEVTADAKVVIDKLLGDLSKAKDTLSQAEGAIAAATSAHAAAIAAKDAEITALQATVADTTNLDARVAARAQLVADARRLGGAALVVDGKSDAEVIKAAVVAKMGDAAKDKPDTFFTGAFDALVAMLPKQAANANDAAQGGAGADNLGAHDLAGESLAAVLADGAAGSAQDANPDKVYQDRVAARFAAAK